MEVVSTAVIDKLYELAQTNLDESSDVQGNLQVTRAYEDAVSYLLNKFSNLQINVTSGTYLRFADSVVQSICATNWGDGTGITKTQAAIVNSDLRTPIQNSSQKANIVSFDELKYFTLVTSIGSRAFEGCTNLKYIDLSNIITLGVGCFQNCTKLATVGDLSGVTTTIGDSQFNSCASLTSIKLGALTIIPQYMFNGCTSLTTVTGANAFTTIKQNAFQNCTSLSTIDLNSLSNADYGVFKGCTNLVSVTNFKSVSVGQSMFDACSKLATIDLSSTQIFNPNAFSNCLLLSNITSLSSSTNIKNGVFNHTSLAIELNLPNIVELGVNAFGYSKITKVTNLGSLTSLGTSGEITFGPFNNCTNLVSAVLPSTLTYIHTVTFMNCTALLYVVCNAINAPILGNSAFQNTTCKIYVPDDSVNAYKAATNWSTYASRIFSLTQFAIDFPNG